MKMQLIFLTIIAIVSNSNGQVITNDEMAMLRPGMKVSDMLRLYPKYDKKGALEESDGGGLYYTLKDAKTQVKLLTAVSFDGKTIATIYTNSKLLKTAKGVCAGMTYGDILRNYKKVKLLSYDIDGESGAEADLNIVSDEYPNIIFDLKVTKLIRDQYYSNHNKLTLHDILINTPIEHISLTMPEKK